LLVPVLLALSGPIVTAATLHVAPKGSDDANCTLEAPCRTITGASSKAAPGDTVLVHAGTYRERVRVAVSGTASAPITFLAEANVEVDGFKVDGNWIVVDGFRVDHGCVEGAPRPTTCRYTGTGGETQVYGFWLSGSDVTMRNNYVTGTHWGGVYTRGSRNLILNNAFIRTGHPGMTVYGSHTTADGNEVADVIPYRYGPDEKWGQDQDGLRVFGSGHVIRNNYIHDIYARRDGPHTDAMQTFDNNGPEDSLIDVLIEGNTIINTASGGMFQSSLYKLSRNVTWRNNIFINGNSHMVQALTTDFRFEGNVFFLVKSLAIYSPRPGRVEGNRFLWVYGTYSASEVITGQNNRAYPSPTLSGDPVKTEQGAIVGVRPAMANIPDAAFRTVADGTSSSLYVSPTNAAKIVAGATIEIDADGFARKVTAVDAASGRVAFAPAISGAMARVPGSTLPADYGKWRIAAADRTVAIWPTSDVKPDFSLSKPPAPSSLKIVR
jgi:hypothetical protein